jgi:hypothetical protein
MKKLIQIYFLLISIHLLSQKSDSIFIKEWHINVKAGTTVNVVNKALYAALNEKNTNIVYQSDGTSYFINPYFAVGVERHFKKHMGFHVNTGFYQTLEKYTTSNKYQPQFSGTLSSNNLKYEQGETQYLNNNVFLEFLPSYILNNTRIIGGLNVTRSSPIVSAKLTITDVTSGKSEVTYIKDMPEESYHVYTVVGILHGIPIKTREFTISITYFGLLQKYDSGINIAAGFMF